jgi:hypothetical protein
MSELTLRQALDELPDTADGIAAYFTEQECRGRRKHITCCPVANYLAGTGLDGVPDVDSAYIGLFTDGRVVSSAKTPPHIAEFVARFDDGEWPELEVGRD